MVRLGSEAMRPAPVQARGGEADPVEPPRSCSSCTTALTTPGSSSGIPPPPFTCPTLT